MRRPLPFYVRYCLLLLISLFALAGCGDPVKGDLSALSQAVKTSGFSPEKVQALNARLSSVRTEADVIPILQELGGMFAKLRDDLKALPLKSDQVKSIRNKIVTAADDMSSSVTDILALGSNNKDIQAQLTIQQKMQAAQQKLIEASTEFKILAKEKGLKVVDL